MIARQSRVNRAAIRKVVSNTVITPTPVPEIDTGYNCALFYELVARNKVFQHTVIDYEEPPYHDDSVLWNEDIGQEDFVLPKKDWDSHSLSDDEQHVYNDAQTRYEYLHQHRACFHDVYSIKDIIPTITELPSDLHLYLVVKEDSFSIMRERFSILDDPTLSHTDASRFANTHFPLESSRLRGDMSKYQLLERATHFAYQDKYIGDIKEQCSTQCLIFLYFILWERFPPYTPSGYDTNHCIKYILAMNADVDLEEPPNLRHLLLYVG